MSRKINLKNSFEIVNKINGMTLDSNYTLASFDIISMYTNISTELIKKALKKDGFLS